MGLDWIAAAWKAAGVVLRAWWRVALQLFHEMIGTVFALFAVSGMLASWRLWTHPGIPWRLGLTVFYSLMMAILAITSFRSSRRLR